jgi:hypothetical protein
MPRFARTHAASCNAESVLDPSADRSIEPNAMARARSAALVVARIDLFYAAQAVEHLVP